MRANFFTTLAIAAATALSGCAVSDDQMARYLVAPDKYVLYRCAEIAKEMQAATAREQELLRLMANADVDAGGRLVSAVAYRPDYLSVRGEINELRAAAAAKHCTIAPADIAPADAKPAARLSGGAIH
jgi:hypothetical protein